MLQVWITVGSNLVGVVGIVGVQAVRLLPVIGDAVVVGIERRFAARIRRATADFVLVADDAAFASRASLMMRASTASRLGTVVPTHGGEHERCRAAADKTSAIAFFRPG